MAARTVRIAARALPLLALASVFVVLPGSAQAASRPAPPDPELVEEMAKDLARYAEAARAYRNAANAIARQEYRRRMDEIRAKYGDQISRTEANEKNRRLDAIAMFEAFLRKYPDDARWTPDAMFRLAELYYEKASESFLEAQEAYQLALDGPNPPETEPPLPDYSQTISLYQRLLNEFPTYRFADAAMYLLGFSLGEMGKEAEAKQAMLGLVCANRYRPLEAPTDDVAESTVLPDGTQRPLEDVYADCQPASSSSRFLPEGWTRVGEFHFDAAELEAAISAYGHVLDFEDSPYFDKALYKLAWSYYRDNRFPAAIEQFDRLVTWADSKKSSGEEFGSDLRPEAIQYLAVSFAEPDWDGDTIPDEETGLQRARAFYAPRMGEPHVKEVLKRLGDLHFDTTRYADAVEVYKAVLAEYPYDPEAPLIQDKIVQAFEQDRDLVSAAREREVLGQQYIQGSAWYERNKDDPEALAVALQLSEDALLSAATTVHAAAQGCKSRIQNESGEQASLSACRDMYATAGDLYEKYLAAYPDSKRAYEFSAYYADALYYSGQTARAIAAYTEVRDSDLDNRYREDSAFRIIKAYEDLLDEQRASGRLAEPSLPDETNTDPPVIPIPMSDLVAQYLSALDWYVANLDTNKVDELRYAAAVLVLRYRNWPNARERLNEIANLFCGQSEMGFKAYDAILTTYFIDYKIQDEREKDCALGRLLSVAQDFEASACATAPGAQEYLTRIAQVRKSVKSTVIQKIANLAIQNEDTGSTASLAQCEDGGGIQTVMRGTKGGATTEEGGAAAKPAEIDVGLALELIDLVDSDPQDQDAAINLNNACVIYERLYQFNEATRCYERLARDYPNSPLALDAVWNAARNHRRFFNFDQAVGLYVQIAEDPKFANYENRRDALGIAAQLLDNDQQYRRAAGLYVRYANEVADKPQDSAQAYSYACRALSKSQDTRAFRRCLRDFLQRYQSRAEAGDFVVDAYMQLAGLAESSGDKRATLAAYRKVRDEYQRRGLKPATPAAAAAAKAEFLMLEEQFNEFRARKLKFTSKPAQVQRAFESFTEEAKRLREAYATIWAYKDATWTLASFLRRGDIYYEFAQKLTFNAENPPAEVQKLEKRACRANPDDCGLVEGQYRDGIYEFVTPIEDEAKTQWKSTLERAAQFGVTNQYVKKARENLSRYLPGEFPFIKDERIGLERP